MEKSMEYHLRRNRIVMAVLLILSLAGITLRGGAVSYCFFFLCLITPLLSACYLIYVYFSFRIYQEVESRTIVKGERIPYRFALTNELFLVYTNVSVAFYSDASVIEQAPEEERYTLFPGDSVRYETFLTGRFRGEYPAGIREVTVVDYLHLFRLRYRVPTLMRISVRPRIPVLTQPRHFSRLQQLAESDTAFRREEADIPVRDYQPGDALKRIHWKASARTGTLKVRTQTGFDALPVQLYLDLRPAPKEKDMLSALREEDTRLECALALIRYFTEEHTPLSLYLPVEGLTVHRAAAENFADIYEQLSRVAFTQEEPHSPWELPEGAYCIWITGHMEEEWLQMVLDTAKPSARVLFVSVTPEPCPQRDFPQHPWIHVLSVPAGARPEEVL